MVNDSQNLERCYLLTPLVFAACIPDNLQNGGYLAAKVCHLPCLPNSPYASCLGRLGVASTWGNVTVEAFPVLLGCGAECGTRSSCC